MTRPSEFLSISDVRDLHVRIFSDQTQGYLRSGAFGTARTRRVEQQIRNVSGRKIRRFIDAVPVVDFAGITKSWSHFMAAGAGTHMWPDGNHRTAMAAFSLFSERAFGYVVGLPSMRAASMVMASKAMRDGDRRSRPGSTRYYTIAELADEDHQYRRLFASYEPDLILARA